MLDVLIDVVITSVQPLLHLGSVTRLLGQLTETVPIAAVALELALVWLETAPRVSAPSVTIIGIRISNFLLYWVLLVFSRTQLCNFHIRQICTRFRNTPRANMHAWCRLPRSTIRLKTEDNRVLEELSTLCDLGAGRVQRE